MNTYTVTQIADAVKNAHEEIQKACELAYRLGELRCDLWNKFGGVQARGVKADGLIHDFKLTNPPENYQLDFKNSASQVLDDIQMTHAAIREQVMRLIYARYPEKAERSALCKALKTLAYQENNVLHRWVRDASGRGHTEVDSHIVLCHNNGAKFNRKNRITEVMFNGLPVEGKNNRYEKITLKFKTGKVNLAGYATIIFHEDCVIRLHDPVKKPATINANNEKTGD